jgi:hypothetical protein
MIKGHIFDIGNECFIGEYVIIARDKVKVFYCGLEFICTMKEMNALLSDVCFDGYWLA